MQLRSLNVIARTAVVLIALIGVPCFGSLAAVDGGQKILKAACADYRVEFRMRDFRPNLDHGVYWGQEGKVVEVCDDLRLYYKGEKAFLRRGVFGDLAEIGSVSMKRKKGGAVITIEGSDAAGSYDCTITVRGDTVTERRVRSGEEPETDYEVTRYVQER